MMNHWVGLKAINFFGSWVTVAVNFPRTLPRAVYYIEIYTPFRFFITRSVVSHVYSTGAGRIAELNSWQCFSIIVFMVVCFVVVLQWSDFIKCTRSLWAYGCYVVCTEKRAHTRTHAEGNRKILQFFYIWWNSWPAKVRLQDQTICRVRFSVLWWTHSCTIRDGAVGWGTALQAGKSWVRFTMVSLEFFFVISFRSHYGPGIDSACNRNEYQEYFLGGKCGRCVWLTTLPPSYADCLEIWEPQPPGTLRACRGL
jgi:hypothetical protein